MESYVKTVVDLMQISIKTAPKGLGKDFLETKVVEGEELKRIGDAMIKFGTEKENKGFVRDGNSVKNSDAMLLVGLKEHPGAGLNCGACGFSTCAEMQAKRGPQFKGPNCMIRLLDFGIALGSAVKTASIHNVDNRIMYRPGVIAVNEGIMNVNVAMGIPLSVTSKSIFFDR
ncbi:MAG: DUF2148 domain-containing protein [Thermoplasmata archaeon]